jgi:fatty-acyl-CoA synthase
MGAAMPTVADVLARRVARSGPGLAVVDGAHRVTWGALARMVGAMAGRLAALGLVPGDRVGMIAPNGLAFVVLVHAAARQGLVLCGLNHRLAPVELAAILRDCAPRAVFFDPAMAALAGAALAGLPVHAEPLTAAECLGADHPAPPAPAVGPDDPLVLVYTSGTTGLPKGAVLSHAQMVWASLTMVPSLDARAGDVHLLPVPLFHVGGLSFAVHAAHLGMTLVLPGAWRAAPVLDLIAAEGVNHFFAVPTMLADLLPAVAADPGRARSLRWVLTGGAPLPAALARAYGALAVPVLQTYGATETGGPGLCVDPAHAVAKAHTIGRPFFHTEMRLVDDADRPVPPGTPGALQLRGGHLFGGYWQNPEATVAAFAPGGWFRTGDIAVQDDDGFVLLVDRAKNLIISGGENIWPAEVERALEAHPDVAEVAVVGLPDPRWGEAVCAVVVARPGAAVTLESLIEFGAPQLARYKLPRALRLVAGLPRNATGKLVRPQIAAMAATTPPDAPAPSPR